MGLIYQLPPRSPLIVVPPVPTGYELTESGLWMSIVRGGFTQIYSGKNFFADFDDHTYLKVAVEEPEKMAILNPDTSKIPLWRRRPERVEHPISAWRCWGVTCETEDEILAPDPGHVKREWFLSSVAADCVWEGPVIRAHRRPVDPAYWDAKKKEGVSDREYYDEMHETFSLAGIHALKTKEQAIETARDYGVSCYGEVDLWGRVAQFELGYRAEACMIKHLYLINPYVIFNTRNDFRDTDHNRRQVKELVSSFERRYGCEVTLV